MNLKDLRQSFSQVREVIHKPSDRTGTDSFRTVMLLASHASDGGFIHIMMESTKPGRYLPLCFSPHAKNYERAELWRGTPERSRCKEFLTWYEAPEARVKAHEADENFGP